MQTTANTSNNSIANDLKVLADKIEAVKRKNWSLSDETIEAYLIGKDKGKNDFVKSVVDSYVNQLNKIQDMVESVYDQLKKNGIVCKTAFMKLRHIDFMVVFVISHDDFHDDKKKRKCYEISKTVKLNLADDEVLTTFRFACDNNLNTDKLEEDGYNAKFG